MHTCAMEMEPRCEVCGEEDPALRRRLEQEGRATVTVPDVDLRALITCPRCREVQGRLIRDASERPVVA